MAVLIQELVDAEFAFVLHTVNPSRMIPTLFMRKSLSAWVKHWFPPRPRGSPTA